jgi:phospholipid/cholesterol/gamma-HCH transport system ATP-binding protein
MENHLQSDKTSPCDGSSRVLCSVENVHKAYENQSVLNGVSMSIGVGEQVALVGPSGSGKSTLLNCLSGIDQPDRGSITMDDQEVTNLKGEELFALRRRFGYLFQGAALFDSLSVAENVSYGLREHLQMTEDAIAERVHESLDSVGLPGIEDMWPADLSGGMKKRVGLARAIAVRPEVLLYDEPTTGLDPINVTRINRLILNLKEKLQVTSIVVTHDMQSAFITSDRLAMIDEGRVIFQGTPDEIRRTEDRRVRDFIEGNADEVLDTETLLRRGG